MLWDQFWKTEAGAEFDVVPYGGNIKVRRTHRAKRRSAPSGLKILEDWGTSTDPKIGRQGKILSNAEG